MAGLGGFNTGGMLGSLQGLGEIDSRLLQLGMNLSRTLPENQRKKQGMLNLLGLGAQLKPGIMDSINTSQGGLGGWLELLT